MKIKTIVGGSLAVDCRTNIHYKDGEVLEEGDRATGVFRGLSKDDLEELVRLKQAKKFLEIETIKVEDPKTEEVEEPEEVEEDEPEYMSFTKKSDLEAFAKEKYEIDLDKRTTLKVMIEQLENALGGDL